MSLSASTLRRAMPQLDQEEAQLYVPFLREAMIEFGITTKARAAAFIAQVGHETLDLVYLEEIASGAAYEGRDDLGNTRPGDGVKYKGRGAIMLTGRANYRTYGRALGVQLEKHPQKASKPNVCFRVAGLFWKSHGLNELADDGDFVEITRRINGGTNGLADRQRRWSTCKRLGGALVPRRRKKKAPARKQPAKRRKKR